MITKLWKNITKKDKHEVVGEPVYDIDQTMLTIDQENMENLEVFNEKLNNRFQKVPMPIISAIATKRLFDCYNDQEIGEVLHYFGQIKEKGD